MKADITADCVVVVTGVGIISSLGTGSEEWLAAAMEGEPAFDSLPEEQADGTVRRAAPIIEYDVAPLLETRKAYLDRHTALLLGATSLALSDAGLASSDLPEARAGIMIGSAFGGLGTMAAFFRDVLLKSARFAKPILFPHTYPNTAISMAAIEWAIKGPHEHYCGGRMASAQAVVAAMDTLRSGDADIILAGGCEALSPALFHVLESQGQLPPADSAADEKHGVPFDSQSRGIVPGEGAAVLCLETLQHAEKRAARPLAILKSSAISGTGLAQTCRTAMAEADVNPSDLAALFAPGIGIEDRDRICKTQLEELLTDSGVPVTALAALQGDCLGANPALDVSAAILSGNAAFVPPLAGLGLQDCTGLNFITGSPATVAENRTFLVAAMEDCDSAAFVVENFHG